MKKEKTRSPLISVVIATYSSERTIEKCLQSLKEQSYSPIEIIVVDSPFYDRKMQEKCKKIIQKYAAYFLDGPERSIQRNRGIHEAKGGYIAVIDQDMYVSKKVIQDCFETITKKQYSAVRIPEISTGDGYWTRCIALDRYITTYLEKGANECCRFFRKKDALAIGGYDATLVGVEDADFDNRMSKKGAIGKSKEVIYHDEGETSFWKRVKKKYYYSKAFRAYLKKNPTVAAKEYFPFKLSYFKHWKLLAKQPAVTAGIIALRFAEITAGCIGLFFA